MNDGIAVPFFGHEAMTTPAVALLALRHRCPICPFRIERLGPARFRLTSHEPLHPHPSGDHKADVLAVMTTLNGILEDWIRARPAEWLWLHRRWSPRVLADQATDRPEAVTEM